ncbi:MAG TPA: response regulator [Pyrinomonadaceae bacterium]|nr:response regulator [Pyrinomonadaceae bacterium]
MSAKSGAKMKKKAAEPPSVLIVEDTEDNRFMMRRLLEMSGYRVFEATNGEEAVKVAQAESPQLILMDLSLPVIDGLAATRLIRKVPDLQTTPIIAVSAHDSSDFQAEAVEAGCNSYVTKPIDFTHLEELIRQLLTHDGS